MAWIGSRVAVSRGVRVNGITKVGVSVAVKIGIAVGVGAVKVDRSLVRDSISATVDSDICEGLAYIMPVISSEANNIPIAMPRPIYRNSTRISLMFDLCFLKGGYIPGASCEHCCLELAFDQTDPLYSFVC